jgi:hypothetical protein
MCITFMSLYIFKSALSTMLSKNDPISNPNFDTIYRPCILTLIWPIFTKPNMADPNILPYPLTLIQILIIKPFTDQVFNP